MRWIRDHGTPTERSGAWVRPNPVKVTRQRQMRRNYQCRCNELSILPSRKRCAARGSSIVALGAAAVASCCHYSERWEKCSRMGDGELPKRAGVSSKGRADLHVAGAIWSSALVTRTHRACHGCRVRNVKSESMEMASSGFSISTRTHQKRPSLKGASNHGRHSRALGG